MPLNCLPGMFQTRGITMQPLGLLTLAFCTGTLHAGEGPGDRREALLKETLATFSKMADILETIKNSADLKGAKVSIQGQMERFKELRTAMKNEPIPSAKRQAELEARYRDRLLGIQKRLFAETMRVRALEGGAELIRDLRDMLSPAPEKDKKGGK